MPPSNDDGNDDSTTTTATTPTTTTGKPIMTFGVIADIQHADIDDGYNFHRTFMRFYRHALQKLKDAIQVWNESKVDFAVQLGDVIDGFSIKHGHRDDDFENLSNIIKQFKCVGLPVCKRKKEGVYVPLEENAPDESKTPYMCHLWGNHEFYNFTRVELWKSELNSFVVSPNGNGIDVDTNISSKMGYYYSFIYKRFRFVALDPYDVGKISRPEGCELHKQAMDTLNTHNKNKDTDRSDRKHPQIVSWNGALSNAQLTWLHNELAAASRNEERVVLLTHVPLEPRASRPASVIWNYLEVLHMINSFECVVACLAGHFHEGGYYHDQQHRIHHLTFQGAIERDPATNAFAVIEVHHDHLKVDGYGKIQTRILRF